MNTCGTRSCNILKILAGKGASQYSAVARCILERRKSTLQNTIMNVGNRPPTSPPPLPPLTRTFAWDTCKTFVVGLRFGRMPLGVIWMWTVVVVSGSHGWRGVVWWHLPIRFKFKLCPGDAHGRRRSLHSAQRTAHTARQRMRSDTCSCAHRAMHTVITLRDCDDVERGRWPVVLQLCH